jgi:hypothetical protein
MSIFAGRHEEARAIENHAPDAGEATLPENRPGP